MSIWSRSHQDLAKLAKDLQDRNSRARSKRGSKRSVDLNRRRSLGSSLVQERRKSQEVKSVRFCLSDGNSPNASFEEEESPNSLESVSNENKDEVFDQEENIHKDEEIPGLKPTFDFSETQCVTYSNSTSDSDVPVNSNMIDTILEDEAEANDDDDDGGEGDDKEKRDIEDEDRPVGDSPIGSSPKSESPKSDEVCEDGSPGFTRHDSGVSKHVLYLLQKDFISSASGNNSLRLTLTELQDVLEALSSSRSEHGEDKNRNMIKMVETLISRQEALIKKQELEKEIEGTKDNEVDESMCLPLSLMQNKDNTNTNVDNFSADQFLSLSDAQKNEDIKSDVLNFSTDRFSNHQDDRSLNTKAQDHGQNSSQQIVQTDLSKNKRDINSTKKSQEVPVWKAAYSSLVNGQIRTDSVLPKVGAETNLSSNISDRSFEEALDEISDEEIKEIIARGKKLLPNFKENDVTDFALCNSSVVVPRRDNTDKKNSFQKPIHPTNIPSMKISPPTNISTKSKVQQSQPSVAGFSNTSSSPKENITDKNGIRHCEDTVSIKGPLDSIKQNGRKLSFSDSLSSLSSFEGRNSLPISQKFDKQVSNDTDQSSGETLPWLYSESEFREKNLIQDSKVSGLVNLSMLSSGNTSFDEISVSKPTGKNMGKKQTKHVQASVQQGSQSSVGLSSDESFSNSKMNLNNKMRHRLSFEGHSDDGQPVSEKKRHSSMGHSPQGRKLKSKIPVPILHPVIKDTSDDSAFENSDCQVAHVCPNTSSSVDSAGPSSCDSEIPSTKCQKNSSKHRDHAKYHTTASVKYEDNTPPSSEWEKYLKDHDKKTNSVPSHFEPRSKTGSRIPKDTLPNHYSDVDKLLCSFHEDNQSSPVISKTHSTELCLRSRKSHSNCDTCRKLFVKKRKDLLPDRYSSGFTRCQNDLSMTEDTNSDTGLSTWSEMSCQCSRCVSFRSGRTRSKDLQKTNTIKHSYRDHRVQYRDTGASDRLGSHSVRLHEKKPTSHKHGHKIPKHFPSRLNLLEHDSSLHDACLPQTVENLTPVSRSSSSGDQAQTPEATADNQAVDANALQDILEDFHELFLCLCRDRRQLPDRARAEGGGGASASASKEEEEEAASVEDRMEGLEENYQQLDGEFDKVLADMKPHVLRLPHKSDRQKCAVWIKKLCEPPPSGLTGRKNRNMYSQLMLRMLKKGVLEGPFDKKPSDGPLPTLPPYMSIYFDEPMTSRERDGEKVDKVPDWVDGELVDSVGSSLFRKSIIGNPAATSTWLGSSTGKDIRERPYTSLGVSLDKDPSLSPPRRSYPDRGASGGAGISDWSRAYSSTTFSSSLPKGTTFQDDTSVGHGGEREVELRTKMVEAKYHEEKLKLQQKHDAAVQKILDRKNAEIEDVKNHYRGKITDLEDVNAKLERKIQTLLKEMSMSRDSKDKHIAELKKLVEDTSDSRKSEYDRKLHELSEQFEHDKFEMQKQHTKNIQEILDDTNARLQRMEKEYTQQMTGNTKVIRELETRVQQLTLEAEQQLKMRSGLEREKTELAVQCEDVTSEFDTLKDRYDQLERDSQQQSESHEHELRTIKHKTEASLEFLKQEHTLAASKASEAVKEMENQVDNMRRKMRESDEQCTRQIRDLETAHQQDKVHIENLHDQQIRSIKKDLEQQEADSQKKMRHLEHLLQEKDHEIARWKEQNREQALSAERALEEFKSEVEKNQSRMYEEMKQQMTQVESDLNKSKHTREKQNRELSRQLEHERSKYERQMTEIKVSFESEKGQMLHDLHLQKEYILSEHEKAVETLKEGHRVELRSLEARYRDRQDKDAKNACESESQVRSLREELVQANQLRKQQLVELGLLREEEKQKMQRDHESELSRLRSEMEQQRLELQKNHSGEMENMLEKTNQRLKDIEKEYSEKSQKSAGVLSEFQTSTVQLRDEIKRIREQSDHRMAELVTQQEEDKKTVKKQYSTNLTALQKELESQRSKCRHLDRQIQRLEADQEEKLTRLKLSYEEKMRGLMPAVVRQELEDIITSLKSQVNSLQQRAAVLQDELDLKLKNPLGTFGGLTSSPIIKSSV